MTRDEFLSDPIGYFNEAEKELPGEWLRAAWESNGEFRSDITGEMRREINKKGQLKGVLPMVRMITAALPSEQVFRLFVALGGGGVCPREPEWRGQFEACVPQCASLLPPIPPGVLRIRYAEYLTTSIQHDMGWRVPELLADYRARGGDVALLGKAAALVPTTDLGEYEVVPVDAPGGHTLVQLADSLGRTHIAEQLRTAGLREA